MRRLTSDDFYSFRYVSDPHVHGSRTAFVVSRPDRKTDDYSSSIWIHDGKIKQFTHGPRDRMPRWSADGKSIAFVSGRGKEKHNQVMVIAADGGEAREVCDFDGDIGSIAWSTDGKSIFFLGTTQKGGGNGKKDDVKRITKYPFYFNAKGFLHDRETQVYRTSLAGKVKQVTRGNFTVNSFGVVPGRHLLVLSLRMDDWDVYTSDLYTCTFAGSGLKSITGSPSSYNSPSVSPDGSTVAFTYRARDRGLFTHLKLCFIPVSGGKRRESTGIDLNIGNSLNSDSRVATETALKWSDDGRRVYFLATDAGNCNIFGCDMKSGSIALELSGLGSIESFDLKGDGFIFVAQTATRPVELYMHVGGRSEKLSGFNRQIAAMKLPEPRHFRFKSFDGQAIDGWVLSHGSRRNAPAVLEIHGGPKTAYGNAFEFEFHLLASNGYNVMFCNPRGSDGYTEEFASRVRGHFGDGDYRDLMLFVDSCLKDNPSWAEDRLGVTGGSYGGFMTNWIIGHTGRFRAAVTQRSISNQVSFFGTSDIGPNFNGDQIGGNFWDNMEEYWEKSPLKYAKSIRTPLLILHSEEDYRCPVEQAYQLYTALRYHGTEAEMELFPGENHELSRSGKPAHRVRRLSSILQWFDRHL